MIVKKIVSILILITFSHLSYGDGNDRMLFAKLIFMSQGLVKNCVKTAIEEPTNEILNTTFNFNPLKGEKLEGVAWPCSDFKYLLINSTYLSKEKEKLISFIKSMRAEEFHKQPKEISHRAIIKCIIYYPSHDDEEKLKECVYPFHLEAIENEYRESLSFTKNLFRI